MSLRSRLLAFFPLCAFVFTGLAFISFVRMPSTASFLSMVYAVYGFPLTSFHILNAISPPKEGPSYLNSGRYSPWWGAHQIQLLYTAFPFFENLLKVIPGAYSVWLRLWGSQIGKRVYWSPTVQILDRHLLTVGDDVIFGHRVLLSSHVIRRTQRGLSLYAKKINIHSSVLVGAESRIGPGVIIEKGIKLDAGTDLYPNQLLLCAKRDISAILQPAQSL